MEVYALTYTVGYYSGYKELVGVYSTKDKAEKAKQFDMKQNGRNEWNYKINPLHVDKTVKETFMEW